MVGIITQSTSLNSFFSISFCVLALALHSYAVYLASARYREASNRAWPGPASKGGTPSEVSAYLGMLVLSCLLLPFFAVCSVLRVGNLANDGVKLGRDHAINPNLEACCRKVNNSTVRRIWRNGLPLAQTLFLAASFLLLLPETLLTAVEVDYGYKTSDSVWSSDVDFLFGELRAHESDVKASINLTKARQALASSGSSNNASGSVSLLPTVRPPSTGGWGADHSVSLAFVNFVLALLVFSVRYASVFWYTNKALTLVFALQLLAMTITSILGYSALCLLYKVCHNHSLYINVHVSLGCGASLALYILGSMVMIFSTVTVFEYGAHYFAEKLRIVERKHQGGEKWVKRTVVVRSGCQGYVPHSCAMGGLVGLAVLKGPLMYDLVSIYRPTQDGVVLAGLVCEALYMVLWIALWCGLTVKQRWQFRILDYVPLGKPLFTIHDHHQVLNNQATTTALGGSDHRRRSSGSGGCSGGGGDGGSSQCLEIEEVPRHGGGTRRAQSRESPPGYLEALSNNSGSAGDVTPDHEVTHSEAGTEESDHVADNVDVFPSSASGGGGRRKVRPGGANRRHLAGQRVVTFQDSAQHQQQQHQPGSSRRHSAGDLGGGSNGNISALSQPATSSSRHLNVKVDVHDHVRGGNNHYNHGDGASTSASSGGGVTRRPRSEQQNGDANTLTREYRNSLRSKCDDLYSVVDRQPTRSGSLGHLPPRDDDVIGDDVMAAEGEEGDGGRGVTSAPCDPLPTLMSSFRDKVRESSRTASSLREQRRHLQFGHYAGREKGESSPQPVVVNGVGGGGDGGLGGGGDGGLGGGGGVGGGGECEGVGSDRRRPYVTAEADPGDITLRLDDSLDSGVRGSSKQGSSSISDDDRNSSSSYIPSHHPHLRHPYNNNNPHPHSQHHHLHLNSHSPVNSTFESDNCSLPSIRENGQPFCSDGDGGGRSGGVVSSGVSSDKPPRQVGGGNKKMDYLSLDKAGGCAQGAGYSSSRHLNIVPRTKAEIGRRDSANYSLTSSSQETSSNDSDHGHGLCSQNAGAAKPK